MATTVERIGTPEIRTQRNREELDALGRAVELGAGSFHLILIEYDLPHWRKYIASDLASRFKDQNIVNVHLAPPPPDASVSLNVLDQLQAQVEALSHGSTPYALVVTGYENLLPKPHDALTPAEAEQLMRALEPLNVGRNVLPRLFPYPMLLCLRAEWIPALEYAPDLSSWRSGYYRFTSDPARVIQEIEAAAAKGAGYGERFRLRRRNQSDLALELDRLKELSEDAMALDLDPAKQVALDERIGWTAIALGNRGEADAAFTRVGALAGEKSNKSWRMKATRGLTASRRLGKTVAVRLGANPFLLLPGADAVTEPDGLFGRDQEVREIIARIISEDPRMLIVWGETGSGKTSLLHAGVMDRLSKMPGYLPVLIQDWDRPLDDVFAALERVSQVNRAPGAALSAVIGQVSNLNHLRVVIICDQFEQFFTRHPDRRDRNKVLAEFAKCINDVRLNCRFVFVLRGDQLSRMTELEHYVPNAFEERKRFYLPLFETSAAVRAFSQLASRANADWPPSLVETVIRDLQVDGRVRPVELQLTACAMGLALIDSKQSYDEAGRAQGLLRDYLDLVLQVLWYGRREQDRMRGILVVLINDREERDLLTLSDIARRAAIDKEDAARMLVLLQQGKLVRALPASTTGADERYELTHDALVPLILGASDQRIQAERVLRRAMQEHRTRRFRTLSWTDQRLIRKHGYPSLLKQPEVARLLRRSSLYRFSRNLLPFLLLLLAYAGALAFLRFLSFDQPDSLDRLVVRRGLPWLSWMPGERIVLDTGYTGGQFRPKFRRDGIWYLDKSGMDDPAASSSAITNALLDSVDIDRRACLVSSDQCWQAVNGEPSSEPISLRLSRLLGAALEVYPAKPWSDATAAKVIPPGTKLDTRLAAHYPSLFLHARGANYQRLLGIQIAVRKSPELREQLLSQAQLGDSTALSYLLLAIRDDSDLARRLYPTLLRALRFKKPLFDTTAAKALCAALMSAPILSQSAFPLMQSQLQATGSDWRFLFARVLLRNNYRAAEVIAFLKREWQRWGDMPLVGVDELLAYLEVAKREPAFREDLLRHALSQASAPMNSPSNAAVAFFLKGESTPPAVIKTAMDWLGSDSPGPIPWYVQAAQSAPGLVPVLKAECYRAFDKGEITADLNDVYLYQALLHIAPEYPRVSKRFGKNVFDYLVDSNPNYRAGASYGIASILAQLAEKEPDPARFLFDHLEARRSIIPYQDAKTLAPYRDAVASAIALWLNSENPVAIRQRSALESNVRALMQDDRMYMRAAAWRIIDESASLAERGAREQIESPW